MFIDLEKSGLEFFSISKVAKFLTDTSARTRSVVLCEFEGITVGSARHYVNEEEIKVYDYLDEISLIMENFFIEKYKEKDKEKEKEPSKVSPDSEEHFLIERQDYDCEGKHVQTRTFLGITDSADSAVEYCRGLFETSDYLMRYNYKDHVKLSAPCVAFIIRSLKHI